ncbi:hypothetical protein [Kitasatospora sp. MAP5-34]|uniref:hypothetical protein n=1 Tax=Kitasatospora sp. MAP5-34 TaxID=3035102 RepID=UPI002476B486|nr:hypothetical protein [Kitasatospora sp. MAP5-34]MDH6580220.1 hypothetical protein [Kitasatospora sp. MAP5-34]
MTLTIEAVDTTPAVPAPDRTGRTGRTGRAEQIGGLLLLLSMFSQGFGVVWDVQWHNDVGPDTFLTLPHLLIYAGPSLAGFTSAIVVLLRTGTERRLAPGEAAAGSGAVKVLGYFRAPVGFLIAGVGGATDLFYGMADLWWHSEYGFDVTLNSPPHVGLALGGVAVCIGTIIVFTSQHQQRLGRWGLVVSSALTTITVVFALFWAQPFEISVTAVAILLLSLVGCVVRRPGWVSATGLVFITLVGTQWLYVPFVTRWYADSVGLPFREGVSTVPQMPALDPLVLPLIAVLLDLVLLRCRRAGVSPGKVLPVAAGVLGVLMATVYGPQIHDPLTPQVLVLAGLLSAGAGWLGYRFSFPLRRLARLEQADAGEAVAEHDAAEQAAAGQAVAEQLEVPDVAPLTAVEV